MNQEISGAGGIDANLAPDALHTAAVHYYKCKQNFRPPDEFSPVPYFLLSRAIELELKSRHLRFKNLNEVKAEFGHNLYTSYDALDSSEKVLSRSELKTLGVANAIYAGKGFEYFEPQDALTGYSRYPDLDELDLVVRKLVNP